MTSIDRFFLPVAFLMLFGLGVSFIHQIGQPSFEFETLVTENVDEARQFQRECWQKADSSVTVKFLVEAWELTCRWEARDE